MDNERETNGGRGLGVGRWAIIAVLIAAGVALFFVYGKRTPPVVEPSIGEAAP